MGLLIVVWVLISLLLCVRRVDRGMIVRPGVWAFHSHQVDPHPDFLMRVLVLGSLLTLHLLWVVLALLLVQLVQACQHVQDCRLAGGRASAAGLLEGPGTGFTAHLGAEHLYKYVYYVYSHSI